jgi:lipopolysaccharide/colanic/teichoic acid biosynthesis glycosyltransferase
MKRILDIVCSFVGLLLLSPILTVVMFLIWKQDYHSPFYIAPRVGKDGKLFQMVKLRSMVAEADKSGVDSTTSNDPRIIPIGHFVRKYKLDEFTQLWNVLKGDMSLVGPRPNVKRETDLYTEIEKGLLSVKPGITDFSSIVFSDENYILEKHEDPDIAYNQLIRPWKSRLGLLYVEHQSFLMDCALVLLTVVSIVSRESALGGVNKILCNINAPADVIRVSKRKDRLIPFPPPGSERIVTSR